jgi:hypothetical protein
MRGEGTLRWSWRVGDGGVGLSLGVERGWPAFRWGIDNPGRGRLV